MTTPTTVACDICDQIDPDLPNTVNADRIGVSEATVRRHKRGHGGEFKGMDLVGATVRQPDGSWYRYRANSTPGTVEIDTGDIEAAVAGFTYTHPAHEPQTDIFVVCASDFQVGKTDFLGGSDGTISRVLASFARAAERAKVLKPREIILADLGDIIENFTNTTAQAQTNDLDLTSQVRVARRLMLEGIKMLAPLAPNLTYVAVPSNHCGVRVGIGNKNAASTPQNDWGLEIQEQIRDVCSLSDSLGHVRFTAPNPLHESVAYAGIGFIHGHQTRSPEKIGEWWKGQSHGRGPVGETNLLLTGHWHSFRVQLSGDARTVMVTPTSDPGSAWFTGTTGERSNPGMLTFTWDGRDWDNLKIV